jgi:outer membrane lipoprotein-sorting protein
MRRIARRTAAALSVLLWLVALPASSNAQAAPKDSRRSAFDPQAIQLLQEMADAYAHLSTLRQETEFTSAITPLVPLPRPPAPAPGAAPEGDRVTSADGVANSEHKLDRKLRLDYAAPNRFRFEVEDTDDKGKLQVSRWVCDGKSFWTFNPEKNLFSREKAPKRIQEFARLAHMTSGSLEVLMLMGVNPFAHIEEQSDGLRYAGKETVNGAATEVVAMSADLGPQTTETRLYIGADDHLLHRLVSETAQKARPPRPIGGGSPLDELAPPESTDPPPVGPDGAPALPGVLMKSRVICDNKIDTQPAFGAADFAFQAPAGALYLTNPITDKPVTLKQRLAELNKSARRQRRSPPKVIRF